MHVEMFSIRQVDATGKWQSALLKHALRIEYGDLEKCSCIEKILLDHRIQVDPAIVLFVLPDDYSECLICTVDGALGVFLTETSQVDKIVFCIDKRLRVVFVDQNERDAPDCDKKTHGKQPDREMVADSGCGAGTLL
jgi:hypothetical protein